MAQNDTKRTPPEVKATEPAAETPEIKKITVELPLTMESPAGYKPRYVEIGNLNEAQSSALSRLRMGLLRAGATLASGRIVATNADAMRYMLEQLT